MTLTIELPPEIEGALLAQASLEGLALSQYVQQLLSERLPASIGTSLTPDQRAAAWRESVSNLPNTPPLSDEAISRESIYGDRG